MFTTPIFKLALSKTPAEELPINADELLTSLRKSFLFKFLNIKKSLSLILIFFRILIIDLYPGS